MRDVLHIFKAVLVLMACVLAFVFLFLLSQQESS